MYCQMASRKNSGVLKPNPKLGLRHLIYTEIGDFSRLKNAKRILIFYYRFGAPASIRISGI